MGWQSKDSIESYTATIVNSALRTDDRFGSFEFAGRSISRLTLLSLSMLTAACGTYNLGNVRPQPNRTADQQQLDMLTCKDQASLAVNSAGHQTANFFLGLTVVGAPVAYANDEARARAVFADCMRRAREADSLKDATWTEVTRLDIGGHNAVQFRVTGTTSSNLKITYVSTFIEGHDQIVFVNAWSSATNAQQQMVVLESLAATVSGIS
jgi:hypothetical protein